MSYEIGGHTRYDEFSMLTAAGAAIDDPRLHALVGHGLGVHMPTEECVDTVANVVADIAEDFKLDPDQMNWAIVFYRATLRARAEQGMVYL